MRFSSGFRGALIALLALVGVGASSAAHADSGTIWIRELKGGWFIGGSGGSGMLTFHGRRYPLSGRERRASLWRFGDEALWPCNQHPTGIRRCWRLWGSWRWSHTRGRGAGYCLAKRQGCHTKTFRAAGGVDGQCRSERPGDRAPISGINLAVGASWQRIPITRL